MAHFTNHFNELAIPNLATHNECAQFCAHHQPYRMLRPSLLAARIACNRCICSNPLHPCKLLILRARKLRR
jgi:hypothetical protein